MCGICVSRRGMVYFGSSIHIFTTLVLFLGSLVRLHRILSYGYDENSKEILGATIISVYFFILLTLGCLIFRGAEKKSPKLLGWSGGAFISLETFAFVFNLLLLSPMGGTYDEYGLRNFGFTVDMVHILLSFLFLIFMVTYCVVIILYICKLREDFNSDYGEIDENIGAPPIVADYFTAQDSTLALSGNRGRNRNRNNTLDSNFDSEHWEQPHIQALNKYTNHKYLV